MAGENSPMRTLWRTSTSPRRPLTPIVRTSTDSTTWWATCGSGSTIGGPSVTPRRPPETPRAHPRVRTRWRRAARTCATRITATGTGAPLAAWIRPIALLRTWASGARETWNRNWNSRDLLGNMEFNRKLTVIGFVCLGVFESYNLIGQSL